MTKPLPTVEDLRVFVELPDDSATHIENLENALRRAHELLAMPPEEVDTIPVADIKAEIDHIERNGIALAKYGGENADEGRCRQLCAMYLREFIMAHNLKLREPQQRSE